MSNDKYQRSNTNGRRAESPAFAEAAADKPQPAIVRVPSRALNLRRRGPLPEPRNYHFGHRPAVFLSAEHVVRTVNHGEPRPLRTIALNAIRLVHRGDLIAIAVDEEKRLRQRGDGTAEIVSGCVAEHLSAELERSPSAHEGDSAPLLKLLQLSRTKDLGCAHDPGARRQGADGPDRTDLRTGQERRHGAHAVPGQPEPGDAAAGEVGGRRFHLGDLLGVGGLDKTALTLAVSGEIKAEHVETLVRQGMTDGAQDGRVPGTGETVTQDHAAARGAVREMDRGRKLLASVIGKLNLMLHGTYRRAS